MKTRRIPAFARAFSGRWRIVEMDQWEDLDLLEPAHIIFAGKDVGELVFAAVEADLDVRYGSRDGSFAPSSHGKVRTTIPTPAAAAGQLSAPLDVLSAIYSSKRATIRGLSPNATDTFGSPPDRSEEPPTTDTSGS